ncbi:MAG TPA: hypothetical protein DEQ98_01275, partial [Acidobacteria bacterium]|nr:hypothetical protein [Acidobacteriota bacterium]
MTTALHHIGDQPISRCVAVAAWAALSACSGTAPAAPARPQSAAPVSVSNTPPAPTRAATLEAFTGGRTRAVWIRDLGDGTDILGFGDAVVVMGLDSDDGLGERPIVERPGTYAKPLFTPRGDRVI